MGIPFVKYLNSLMLESAYKDLIYTDYSITYIEINNGFPDNKAFTKTYIYIRLILGNTVKVLVISVKIN
ncbi:hypothetical protein CSC2_16490 [Clostridium zeae]|uniref:HTH araC/xylS-type domain-containing protein n=1 Tax=Clostridium zeae TaxID=2759022 RepID=A0ABQ1E8Q6_9CLOT|nr:hypothetical protein CSC2_16490 [Clostridium zeae]